MSHYAESMENIAKAKAVTAHFNIEGTQKEISVNTQGHINSTFISVYSNEGQVEKYTHQLINKNVFRHPDEVMENIVRVTSHIRKKVKDEPDAEKRTLSVIPALDGKPYYLDEEDNYWRTYRYIDGVDTFDTISSDDKAYELGQAIGTFQTQLSDFDGSSLYTTIPHFHDMILRYSQLDEALKINYENRAEEMKDEIDFLMANRERGAILWRGFEEGTLPSRVTHNDTKMNNVLFDKKTGEGLCVIDLDTIMPGTVLFDTGDMIRTACNTGGEDEKDLSLVTFSVPCYKALILGYREKAQGFLTEKEDRLIKESGRNITQIMAVRFLTDYLAGDKYYKIAYPEHNAVRVRTQLKLIHSMDEQWDNY